MDFQVRCAHVRIDSEKPMHFPLSFDPRTWHWDLLAAGVARRDPVIIFGQAPALIVYIRNLMLIRTARSRSL